MRRLSERVHPLALVGKLKPGLWLPGLTAGVLTGFTEIIFAVALASLVFSGELAPLLPYGVGMALVSAAVMLVVIALASAVPGVMGTTQDGPSAILAVMAAGLASALSGVSAEPRLATIAVAIGLTTVLTGAFFILLGRFKLGGLVRYMPYPVVGGFIAGTGWLLVRGAFAVMTGDALTLKSAPALVRPEQLTIWVPGALFALALFGGLRRIRHALAMPGILLGSLAMFGLGTAVGDLDLYQGAKCSASVVADSEVVAYRLTRAALAEMKAKQPELAATFHEFAAYLLPERLAATTRTLEALLR